MRSHLLKFGLGVILFITVGLLFVFGLLVPYLLRLSSTQLPLPI